MEAKDSQGIPFTCSAGTSPAVVRSVEQSVNVYMHQVPPACQRLE